MIVKVFINNKEIVNTLDKSNVKILMLKGEKGNEAYTAGEGISIENGVISNTRVSAEWGNIEGNLEDQTDLQTALGAKADTTDIPTDLSQLSNTTTKYVNETELSEAIASLGSVFTLKGSVATVSALPSTGNTVGDVYYVESESAGYVWINDNGTERWEQLGMTVDTSDFLTKSGLAQTTGNSTNNTMSQAAITTALGDKANTSDLADVATSGSYNDLSNKPTIPTMGNYRGTSNTNGYSQSYLNEHIVNVGGTEDHNYEVSFIKSKNLFDMNKCIKNARINDNGVIESSTGTTLFYIPIEVSTKYKISFVNNSASGEIRYSLTNLFPVIGVQSTPFFDTTVSTFNGLNIDNGSNKYLVFCLDDTNQLAKMSNIQVEEGNTATTYEQYIVPSIKVNGEEICSKDSQVNVGTQEDNSYKINVLYSPNLIKPTLATTTNSGITVTNNGNGTYTVNGTASATVTFTLLNTLALTGTYKLTGCPAGGTSQTYYMYVRNSAWSKFAGDLGEGKIFTSDTTMNYVEIAVNEGTVCNNLVFKPMITEDTSKTYADFEPYVVPSIKVNNEEIYRKKKVLWENPAISNDFAAGNITLNDSLANYSYYEVIFLMSKYEQIALSSGLIPATMNTSITTLRVASGTGIIVRYRDLTRPNDTTLQVTVCSQISGSSTSVTTNTDRIIPYQIIGHA